jgi:lipopolysaccharide/colanic/teichoic acid biosynthesis glycosyltransferase
LPSRAALPCSSRAPADRGLLISLEDRGPVFFKQQRQGRNNRLFWIYKFRSMRVAQLDSAGARSASKDDDRITRIGRLIRRTSIDELPS